jgi:hypothetical protein
MTRLGAGGAPADAPPAVREADTAAVSRLLPGTNGLSDAIDAYKPGGALADVRPHLQRHLTRLVESAEAARLRNTLSNVDNARVIANAAKWASTWLLTVPSRSEFCIPNMHYRIAFRLRLGLPPLAVPNVGCVCGASLATAPLHPLHCGACSALVTARHDGVKQRLAQTAHMLGADALLEPRTVIYSDDRHPDIALLIGNTNLTTDVTIANPLAPSNVRRAQRALATAIAAETRKEARYAEEAKQQGTSFCAFGLEVLGGWGPQAQALAKRLINHAETFSIYSRQEAQALLLHSVSVALQQGNAQLLIGSYQAALSRAADMRTRPQVAVAGF